MRLYSGCIDKDETPRDCIIRECYEELGIEGTTFKYLGLMKFLMMPDYFSSKERIEYGGLYGVTLENMTIEEIYHQINDRAEIVKLAFYKDIKDKELGFQFLDFCIFFFGHGKNLPENCMRTEQV